MAHKKPVCENCDSERVWSDAVAFYNVETQAWDIADANGVNFGCNSCDHDDVQIKWFDVEIVPNPESERSTPRFKNFYDCNHNKCCTQWTMIHDCTCDDPCPVCGTSCSPTRSIDFPTED